MMRYVFINLHFRVLLSVSSTMKLRKDGGIYERKEDG